MRFEDINELKKDGMTYYSMQKPLSIDTSNSEKVWGLKEIKKACRWR